MSYLNLISLMGIVIMVGLAWLMSSHRTRVNWRLVGFGLLLQLVLAAALFQSQTWTFNGTYPNGILFAGVESFFHAISSYVNEGISAGHLLTASIISAPAALVIAKVLQPEVDVPGEMAHAEAADEKIATNVIEAAAIGASEGMKLAINIAAMLIAFLALIALINSLLFGLGEAAQAITNLFRDNPVDFEWGLNGLFATVFYPLAWVMGIESGDCGVAGRLLGTKVVVNEFVAYLDLGTVLEAGELSNRSEIILTYALCGFSNFAAIGIQIGGIAPLAPERRGDLAQLGLRAMFGGMLACCMTACMAGIMYGVLK